jgi:hypothetical protein
MVAWFGYTIILSPILEKMKILDVCFLIFVFIHIECNNSILMHLIVRKLLGLVVFLDVL